MLNLNDRFNEYFLKEYFDGSRENQNGWLLDLGCGSCPYEHLYESSYLHVVRSDIEVRSDAVDVISDISNLPFEEDVFDAVLISEVIEHVRNDVSALDEIRRVLKSNGQLIITWPFLHQLHEIPNDYRRLTEFGMHDLLSDAGFDVHVLKRRGDILSLLVSIIGDLLVGAMTAIVRIPIIGHLFRPLQWILHGVLSLCYIAIARIQYKMKHLNPVTVGGSLSGISGTMAMSTLGYFLVAQKSEG